ncbi:MAG: exodeoxyribonuclease III [Pelagibacterales bacterium MED-G40]|nr:MAG: exodeoxyribonuclease III [Pelagibacterales bacterium MED-G40]|tara:strand:- start:5520 stop:6296 length:777 start_codon:yes stop_codon:yes gene_type:complete
MKISSWNVNSVRARIENIIKYLKDSSPDVLMIQEIKTEDKNFPYEVIKDSGYESYVFGQKSYNGVAFLSKKKIDKINKNSFKDKYNQSRIIEANIENKSKEIKLINIYVPNGNPINTEKYEYKKIWLNTFIKEIKNKLMKNKNIIIGGDFNVIPEEIDVYNYKKYENDALFKLEIRKKFRELINLGFQDIYRFLNKEKTDYTFWDYMAGSWQKNYGMRIDHFLVSNSLLSQIKTVNINKKPRGKVKPSDHTPIEIEIS